MKNPTTDFDKKVKILWSKEKLISYGELPNKKYMINWPINGNDYYINSIEMNDERRFFNYEKAKQKSLRFLYFIQTEMGFAFKLGLIGVPETYFIDKQVIYKKIQGPLFGNDIEEFL